MSSSKQSEPNAATAVSRSRKTDETDISVQFGFADDGEVRINTGVPFFDHMLHAWAFHGGMACTIEASGDVEIDPHHLVEDVGLVLGDALLEYVDRTGPVARFGHSVVPMDDAVAEVAIDIGGRPYLVYHADFPQDRAGSFDVSLVREFLHAFASRGRLNLHAACRYGLNSHHMIEALFKALGRALGAACRPSRSGLRSTKGAL